MEPVSRKETNNKISNKTSLPLFNMDKILDQLEINKLFENPEYDLGSMNLMEKKSYIIKDTYDIGKNFVRKFCNFNELKKIIKETSTTNDL